MNVLVTGGSGRIGRYVVADLAAAGHTVTNVDLTPAPTLPGHFLRADLTDAGAVYGALAYAQAEAVVHLGAWPDAGIVPDARTYGDNVRGAYNLFQACADLGIRRIVYASSAQVYGFAAAPPVYVPADEDHPLRPVNSYALAKCAAEQAAEYFIRTRGLEILSFRFMGVRLPEQIGPEIDALAANPATGAALLWTRTDARDAATACRLALESPNAAPGPYNITGAEVVLTQSTEDLVGTHFADATAIRGALEGHRSPLSTARAVAAFGYRPRFVWSQSQRFPTSDSSVPGATP
jgi:nucleoside-diphosphate-sugar epimerase